MRDTVSERLSRKQVLARCRILTTQLTEQWCSPAFDRSKVAVITQEIEGLLNQIGLGFDQRARERTDLERLIASEKTRIARSRRKWITRRGFRNGKAT